MKICPYCRNVMATGQTICDMCGEVVPDVEMVSKKSIVLKPHKAPTQIPNEPVSDDTERKYQWGKATIIASAVGIVLLGIIIALVIFL